MKIKAAKTMIEIKEVIDNDEKIQIMKECDAAFPIRLFDRDNSDEIVYKITQKAFFYAAYKSISKEESCNVGYVAFYANDLENKNAYISNIGVCNEMQEKHIGSMLMETCLKVAKEAGMVKMRLEVLDTNVKAIAFYKKWGFTYEGEAGESSVYMKKNLI